MSDRLKLYLSALAVGAPLGVLAAVEPIGLAIIGVALGFTAFVWGALYAFAYFDNPYK